MSYTDLTYIDFKKRFYKDFNFIEKHKIGLWQSGTNYLINDIIYIYNPNTYFEFYKANSNINSTVEPFNDLTNWTLDTTKIFNDYIIEDDFLKSKITAKAMFRADITGEVQDEAFLLLTAHQMTIDKEIKSLYVVNPGQTSLISSESIDGGSVSYTIPQYMLNGKINQQYFNFTKFGRQYLMILMNTINQFSITKYGFQ